MQRINKPRVFLSHSKLDTGFIQRLYNDLRKCQIEPWLDTEEIRHGKPWLDAIFEDGIPTCDCVLLYFTENSLESKMVKKEMDTAIIHQLKEGGVSFLPYVINEIVRNKLRADIQVLQAPIWTTDNYSELLPVVVAEIWRSFLERTISTAVQGEKVRRLQAELELEKSKQLNRTIFTDAEEADFQYIWESLDRYECINAVESKPETGTYDEVVKHPIKKHTIKIHVGKLVALLTEANKNSFESYSVTNFIESDISKMPHIIEILESEGHVLSPEDPPNIVDDLLMFGLVEAYTNSSRGYILTNYSYTDKIQRFRYWLRYRGQLPKHNEVDFIQ